MYHFTFDTVWDEVYERARELYGEQGNSRKSAKSFGSMHLKNAIRMIVAGESNNTCIMYTLLSKPALLLLDEPIDPWKKEELFRSCKKVQQL